MQKYLLLFRGINVGGRNILPMRELVELLEGAGYKNVLTYIQSGNVILQDKKKNGGNLITEISSLIRKKFGFDPKIMVRNEADLQDAIEHNPFDTNEGKALHFFFLEAPANSVDLACLKAVKSASEEYLLFENVFYLYAPSGIGRSKLVAKLDRCLGVATTARNWNTIRQLRAMMESV